MSPQLKKAAGSRHAKPVLYKGSGASLLPEVVSAAEAQEIIDQFVPAIDNRDSGLAGGAGREVSKRYSRRYTKSRYREAD